MGRGGILKHSTGFHREMVLLRNPNGSTPAPGVVFRALAENLGGAEFSGGIVASRAPRELDQIPKRIGGCADGRLLSPSLSSTPSGGEGARRAGEEVPGSIPPDFLENWYYTRGTSNHARGRACSPFGCAGLPNRRRSDRQSLPSGFIPLKVRASTVLKICPRKSRFWKTICARSIIHPLFCIGQINSLARSLLNIDT